MYGLSPNTAIVIGVAALLPFGFESVANAECIAIRLAIVAQISLFISESLAGESRESRQRTLQSDDVLRGARIAECPLTNDRWRFS